MISTIGQKLRQTREKRGIALDEAAHATKLRQDQIIALEIGDYAAFASSSYARSFLKIYGRYLRIDVESEAATLSSTNPISIEDYQYLSTPNQPPPEPDRSLPDLSLARRRKPSLLPLLASAVVIIFGLFAFTNYVNWQRIKGDSTPKSASVTDATPPSTEPAAASTETPLVAAATQEAAPTPAEATLDPVATAPGGPGVMAVDRQFLGEPTGATPASPAPSEPLPPVANPDRDIIAPMPVAVNEVEVSVARKTWVTIRREENDAAPVFEDYLYPGLRPLKLKGTRFIIEARDPGVVEIRKNGAPIAYQRPGVTVQ